MACPEHVNRDRVAPILRGHLLTCCSSGFRRCLDFFSSGMFLMEHEVKRQVRQHVLHVSCVLIGHTSQSPGISEKPSRPYEAGITTDSPLPKGPRTGGSQRSSQLYHYLSSGFRCAPLMFLSFVTLDIALTTSWSRCLAAKPPEVLQGDGVVLWIQAG